MKIITVIIPAYNHLNLILRCLHSLKITAYRNDDIEYLVQDDCSPEYNLQKNIDNNLAKTKRNPINMGFSGTCNAAAERASTNILLFINQDVYAVEGLSNNWDATIYNTFDNSEIGIVGARLLFPNGSIQSAGGMFDLRKQPFHRYLGYGDRNFSEVSTPMSVPWVTGAALAVSREAFSGFDRSYEGGYFEDVDLCLKIRERGFKVLYEPRCTFVHEVGCTGGNRNFKKNAILFNFRWHDKITPDVSVIKNYFY